MMILIGIYICIASICALIGGIVTESDDENEENILKHAFYIQKEIHKHAAKEVNTIGVIISVLVASFFLLPCNLMLIAIHLVIKFGGLLWSVFKVIFKKR